MSPTEKDWISILVCNAIRAADHRRNELEVGMLSDEDVWRIAVRAQADFYQAKLIALMGSYQHLLVDSSSVGIGGAVTPPEDLIQAAKTSLGERFNEFIEIYGTDFAPIQLAQFCDGLRE